MPSQIQNSWIRKAKSLKEQMSEEQKRKLLVGLKKFKEEYTGNVGGETDIMNADNLQTNENEFTSGDTQSEPKVIAKTFDTKSDFDSYVNQRRGIEMTQKELQAIGNYRDAKPTQQDRFFVRYETTDDFGNNDTTVIKKLKEGGQFCWTAFSKHESAEEEGKPENNSGEMNEAIPPQSNNAQIPSEPEEVTADDPIRITKSTTFMDETQGADILANFLAALDL